jgi:hypothetical protein
MSARARGIDDPQSAEYPRACRRERGAMPAALVERHALELVLVFVFIVFVLGRAIFEHGLVLFAPRPDGRLDRSCCEPQRDQHQLDIDEFVLLDIARRLRVDRSRDVRRPFGHLSPAC